MDKETMLTAVKVDLGITTTAYDVRLGQYLDGRCDHPRKNDIYP